MDPHITLRWYGNQTLSDTRKAEREALRMAAEHLLTESKKQTPVNEGILKASGAVTPITGGTSVAVSYDTPYAVRQHEELSYRHPKGGKAKYLEDPAREEHDTMQRIFTTHMQRLLRTR